MENLIGLIQTVSKQVDKEGDIIKDEEKYWERLESIRAELGVPEREDLEKLQAEIDDIKKTLKNHHHVGSSVLVEL